MPQQLNRRRWLRLLGAGAVGGTLAGMAPLGAEDPAPADFQTPESDAAVRRGLAYLAQVQGEDGSFQDSNAPNVGVTALAGLALMAAGHHPGRGAYGKNVSRALDYLLNRCDVSRPVGYLTAGEGPSHSGMYQHGFGTLFLAELYGMVPEFERARRLRDALEKSTALIVNSQNREGGWRYHPYPSEGDVSVTVAEMMALRASRNAGVFVPKSTIDAGVRYIKGCQLDDGGFCYIYNQKFSGSLFPRSAAAVVGLYSAGIYDGKEIERGLKYLGRYLPGRRGQRGEMNYYYGQYYAALAMWTAGGTYWNDWFPAIRDELLARSRQFGGTWSDMNVGSAFGTAIACIILQLPNNYLPILQK
ncbi:MAG: prenyltransferase/squalene oxidase repeat-containing protein [Gemmataceae bacterium]